MPLLFSYGTLQLEDVQRSTFGRLLDGEADELIAYEPALVKIEDRSVVAAVGRTHHANVRYTGLDDHRVRGTVFEVTDAELSRADAFEAAFEYVRVRARLASGREGWVYLHYVPPCPDEDGTL